MLLYIYRLPIWQTLLFLLLAAVFCPLFLLSRLLLCDPGAQRPQVPGQVRVAPLDVADALHRGHALGGQPGHRKGCGKSPAGRSAANLMRTVTSII